MSRRALFLSLIGLAWGLSEAPRCFAIFQFHSIDRGIIVDGTTISTSNAGSFLASHSNTNEFGTATASISSLIEEGRLCISGWASIDAVSNEVFSPEGRAKLFFESTFSIDIKYEYSLTGLLIGTSESEHWGASLSLLGPTANAFYSAYDHYIQIDESGTLLPGHYTLSVNAFPDVLGGLDGGSATAYISGSFEQSSLTLLLIPKIEPGSSVPEATSMVVCSLLVVVGFATRPPVHSRRS